MCCPAMVRGGVFLLLLPVCPPLALLRVWCVCRCVCGAHPAPLLLCPTLAALVPRFALLPLLLLACGLLVALGGGPRVGASYPFLYPCLLGPALLPCAHFALSHSYVAMPFCVPPLLHGPVGKRMGVQEMGLVVGHDGCMLLVWSDGVTIVCVYVVVSRFPHSSIHTTSTVLAS